MTAKDLIDQYKKNRDKEIAMRSERISHFSKLAENAVRENFDRWFEDFKGEFILGDIKAIQSDFPRLVKINANLIFNGLEGYITIDVFHRELSRSQVFKPRLVFKFKSENYWGDISNEYDQTYDFELPISNESFYEFEDWKTHLALRVQDMKFAEFLYRVTTDEETRADKREKSKVNKRNIDIKRFREELPDIRNDKSYVERLYREACESHPDLKNEWDHLFTNYFKGVEEHNAELEAKAQAEQEAEEKQRAEWEAEREYLQDLALEKFEPFILYRAHYGYSDEDGNQSNATAWLIDDEPSEDGWYYVIDNGVISRSKFPGLVRIDECVFDHPSKVPCHWNDKPLEYKTITSEKFDMQETYPVIPAEIIRLDEVKA